MTQNPSYYWTPADTPAQLHPMLRLLEADYPIQPGRGTLELRFIPRTDCALEVRRLPQAIEIRYNGRIHLAARGIGIALAGKECRCKKEPFQDFGIMFDCSRQAVPTVCHLQKWLRQLALLGYNMLMLYTEDTYVLPDEPAFGYMRGGYSADEIRAVDDCAAALGIELVPCIQTLGHLAQYLKWPETASCRDTQSVLLVDAPETARLIDKMLKFWRANVRSRKIHIGMDEAHDLGRGRYLDQHGFTDGFTLFNRHLTMVEELCGKYDFHPMIWSDMYFRIGNPDSLYYAPDTVIPDSVRRQIPRKTQLVYWDYYHDNREFYREWIRRHREDLGKDPLAASGVWCWSRFWYDHRKTMATAGPFLKEAQAQKLKMFLITLWGNDGASCDFDSTFAGLAFCAGMAYGNPDAASIFEAVTGGNFKMTLRAGDLQFDTSEKLTGTGNTGLALWDDPIFGMAYREFERQGAEIPLAIIRRMNALAKDLLPYRKNHTCGDFNYAYIIADLISHKFQFYHDLRQAVLAENQTEINQLKQEIPIICKKLEELFLAFRKQWLRAFKSFGMEDCQSRIATLIARYHELSLRLDEGTDALPEFRIKALPAAPNLHYPQMSKTAGIAQ